MSIRTQKLTTVLRLAVAVSLVMASATGCANLFGGDSGEGKGSRLTITGSLAGVSGTVVSASSVDFSQVEEVMLFYGRDFVISPVDDGRFSIPVSELAPSGILLVGPDQSYAGVLSFGETETSIPLQVTDETTTAIDLGLLQAGEIEATTSVDLDGKLGVSGQERTTFSAGSDFFESVMRNPDINGNGIVDPLEGLYIFQTFQINLVPWTIPSGALTPASPSVTIDGYNPYIGLFHPSEGVAIHEHNATLTFPDASTVDGEGAGGSIKFGNHAGLPAAGAYNFSMPDDGISFDYDLSQAASDGEFLYVIVPTMVLNGDGTIDKVTWEIVDKDMNPVPEAPLIIKSLYMGFDVSAAHAGTYGLPDEGTQQQVYDVTIDDPTVGEHVFENQGIAWEHVAMAYTTVTDVFRNEYFVEIQVEH